MKKIVFLLLAALLLGCLRTPAYAFSADNTVDDYTKRISVGGDYDHEYYLAVLDDNTLWGWGYDYELFLGLKYSGRESVPQPTKIMDNVKAAYAGWGHALIIKTDGSLWGWGENMPAAGEERLTCSLVPIKLMDDVVSAACGQWHTLAVKSDGSLWGWGKNYRYTLKAPSDIDHVKSILKPVKLMEGVTKVASSGMMSSALKKDGTLLCWAGYISSDKESVINGVSTSTIATGVKDMYLGEDYMYYLKNDGSFWGIGKVVYESLGSTDINKIASWDYTPVKIMDGVASASAGVEGVFPPMAVKTDGKLVAWGATHLIDTMLGREPSFCSKPINVMNGVRAVETGGSSLLIMKTDGSILSWGSNQYGGIGDGGDGSGGFENFAKQPARLSFDKNLPPLFTQNTQQPSKLLSDFLKQREADGTIAPYNSSFKANWLGGWTDNIQVSGLAMKQKGTVIEGYDMQSGLLFRATADGNKLRGYWSCGETHAIFEITMAPGNKSFTGCFYPDGAVEAVIWTGTRWED